MLALAAARINYTTHLIGHGPSFYGTVPSCPLYHPTLTTHPTHNRTHRRRNPLNCAPDHRVVGFRVRDPYRFLPRGSAVLRNHVSLQNHCHIQATRSASGRHLPGRAHRPRPAISALARWCQHCLRASSSASCQTLAPRQSNFALPFTVPVIRL